MPRRTADTPSSGLFLFSGRVLAFLTIAVIAFMPLTEYLWHFDRFLQGGQDLELGLLSIMTFFCLILVLFRHGRRDVSFRMALRCWFVLLFRPTDPAAPGSFSGLITFLHVVPLPSASLGIYNLPLQI